MRKEFQWILLLIILLECLDNDFAFQMSGSPYSFGKIAFIIMGLSYFPSFKNIAGVKIIGTLFIIYLSYFIAAFYSESPVMDNLSPAIGVMILFLASLGFGVYLFRMGWVRFLDIFFISLFVYWSYYILKNTVVGGTIISYGTIDDIINHHVSGVNVSISGLYIIFRYRASKISFVSISIVIFTLMVLILSESRSNLIMFALTYLLSFIFQYGSVLNLFKSVVVVVILIAGVGYNAIFSKIFQNEEVSERFDPTNQQYIKDTNVSRVELYAQFLPSLLNHPFGKGMDNPKVDTIYGEKLMHNKYATYIIKGGLIAVIPTIIFLRYLFLLFLKTRKIFATYTPASIAMPLKSITMVLICYYFTLLTVDFGGLLDFMLFSVTLLLVLLVSGYSTKGFIKNGQARISI